MTKDFTIPNFGSNSGDVVGDIEARVLHRDGLMLVIDKPSGIPVHRGPRNSRDKSGTALEDYFEGLRFGLPRPPVLAHRLDRDTSGCLVLGRHRKATATLGLLFKHAKISKTYWAVVEGSPDADEGTIDIALGRLDAERGWWQKPDPDGLPAQTRWKVLGRTSFVTSPLAGEEKAFLRRRLYEERRDDVAAKREAFGRGVDNNRYALDHPPSQPSPARGEGADRVGAGSSNHSSQLTWLP